MLPQWYPPAADQPRSGVDGEFVREHARAVSRFDDVVVLHTSVSPTRSATTAMRRDVEDGVVTYRARLPNLPIPRLSGLLLPVGTLAAIARVVGDWGLPDVVHAQDHAAMRAAIAAGAMRVPFVVSQHWSGFARGVLTRRDRVAFSFALPRAHSVLAIHPDAAEHMRAYRIHCNVQPLVNTVDTAQFVYGHGPRTGLLHASGMTEEKRVEDLIRGFAILVRRRPDATLTIAGDGPRRGRYESLARELTPAGAVRFVGFVAKHELASLMREAAGFVLTSIIETFGCVLIEAMASGCPVITTSVGGIPRVVREGEGLYIDGCDHEGIADAMQRVLEGQHGLDLEAIATSVKDRYSHEAVGRQLAAAHKAAVDAQL